MILFIDCLSFCHFLFVYDLQSLREIKLWKPDDKPDYSYSTWFAVLFSAGMGMGFGLVFYGAVAPISQYMKTPLSADPRTAEELGDAIGITFFHYGIHAWAVLPWSPCSEIK